MIAQSPIVCVTDTLMRVTVQLIASFVDDRGRDAEGIVYWFGLELAGQSVVTTLVVPDADTTRGNVRTSAAANAEALSTIVDTPLVLLGQVHSHPFEFVTHSTIDDRETFAQFEGALSVVVPFFGKHGMELSTCGVHRHLGGSYRRIAPANVADHLRVLPGFRDFRPSSPGATS